jgi:hypothetical protein
MRGIFFDEETARVVEAELVSGGYAVTLGRVRYAGEDDDEDHPWTVSTDAPALVLEVFVDRYDGWLDEEPGPTEPPASSTPLDLPSAPKRHHRPQ